MAQLVAGIRDVWNRARAEVLRLPFLTGLEERTTGRPQQKDMANSVQQALNVDGAFGVTGQIRSGPVLLVDDMVDSGWTLTVAAWLLRENGSGQVWPLALADAGHRR